jgi:hypothetical protein
LRQDNEKGYQLRGDGVRVLLGEMLGEMLGEVGTRKKKLRA